MGEKKKISTKIKNFQEKEKKQRAELLEVIEQEIDNSKTPKEIKIEKADFIEVKSDKDSAKKMVVEKVWGVKKENDVNIGKRQKLFKTLFTVTFIVFVVGVLAYTAYNDFFASGRDMPEWEDFKRLLTNSWQYLIYAALCLFLGLVFKGLKLSIMCKPMTGKFHLKTCFETGIIGSYYNNVTPLAVGGQPFEIYHLSKHGVHGGVASSLPIMSYITNQFAFVALGAVAVALYSTNALGLPIAITGIFPATFTIMAVVGIICCSIMPILVVLFCLMPRTCSKVVHLVMYLGGKMRIIKDPKTATMKTIKNVIHNAECLKKLAANPLVLISTLLFSFFEHISNTSIAFFTLMAFNFTVEGMGGGMQYLQILQLCFILSMAVSFIPTPGNAGAADLSFYVLFESGLKAGFAFPAMAIWRGLNFYSYIVIGFLFATFKKRADRKREALKIQSGLVDEQSNVTDQPPNSDGTSIEITQDVEAQPQVTAEEKNTQE